MSEKYTIRTNDLINGVKTAVFTALLGALYSVTLAPDFNLFTTDWVAVGQNMANVGFLAFTGYLARKFLENSDGELIGK